MGTHFDMLELEHIPLNEGAPDLLIGPCDEQLVVMICLRGWVWSSHIIIIQARTELGEGHVSYLLCESSGEENRILEVHSVPMDAQS